MTYLSQFMSVLQKIFKANTFDLVTTNIRLISDISEEEQIKLINEYYNDEKGNPGINETQEGIRRNHY